MKFKATFFEFLEAESKEEAEKQLRDYIRNGYMSVEAFNFEEIKEDE